MVQVLGKPFVQYQIEHAKANGITEIVLCVGYKSEIIKDFAGNGSRFGLRIRYSDEGDKLLDTGGAIANAIDLLDNEFLVINGDSYLPINFSEPLSTFHRSGKAGLMTLYRNNNRIYKSNANIKRGSVVVYDKSGKTPGMKYLDYGLSIFKKKVFTALEPNRFPLDDIYNKLIRNNDLAEWVSPRTFYDIGNVTQLRRFANYVKRRMI